jgi:SP family galactose:H+ symporter-like MFS transporter
MLIFVCILLNLSAGVTYGYNLTVNSGILFPVEKEFPSAFVHVSTVGKGFILDLISSCYISGGIIGSFIGSRIVATLGRKVTLFISGVLVSIFSILSAVSTNFWMLISMRIFIGFGCSLMVMVSPMYVSEMTRFSFPRITGILSGLFQIGLTFGTFLGYIMSFAFNNVKWNWRWMVVFCNVSCVPLIIITILLPESTAWIQFRQNIVLQKQKQSNKTEESQDGYPHPSRLRRFLKTPMTVFLDLQNLKRYICGVALVAILMLTGVSVVLFYTNSIFIDAGLKGNGPALAGIGLGAWIWITSFLGFTSDWFGRRPVIILGVTLMTVSPITLGFLFYFVKKKTAEAYSVLVFIFIFMCGYSGLFGTNYMVSINEMFPVELRAFTTGSLVALLWIFNLIVSLTFTPLVTAIGQGPVFWIFGGIAVICWIIVVLFLPETKLKKGKEQPIQNDATENYKDKKISSDIEKHQSQEMDNEGYWTAARF